MKPTRKDHLDKIYEFPLKKEFVNSEILDSPYRLNKEFLDWVSDNIIHDWSLCFELGIPYSILFSNAEDAATFKITWMGEK